MSEKSSTLKLFSANETIFERNSKVRISERNTKLTLVFHSEREYLQDAKQIKNSEMHQTRLNIFNASKNELRARPGKENRRDRKKILC